jgi:hypothetical protein
VSPWRASAGHDAAGRTVVFLLAVVLLLLVLVAYSRFGLV